MAKDRPAWQHFPHDADIGIRGQGATVATAFEQAALALTAIVTDLSQVSADTSVELLCEAPDIEVLFVDFLNTIIFEMATRKMLFSRYQVTINGHQLRATAWGEAVDKLKHQPAVEIKGATYTQLNVTQQNQQWVAQCIVDV